MGHRRRPSSAARGGRGGKFPALLSERPAERKGARAAIRKEMGQIKPCGANRRPPAPLFWPPRIITLACPNPQKPRRRPAKLAPGAHDPPARSAGWRARPASPRSCAGGRSARRHPCREQRAPRRRHRRHPQGSGARSFRRRSSGLGLPALRPGAALARGDGPAGRRPDPLGRGAWRPAHRGRHARRARPARAGAGRLVGTAPAADGGRRDRGRGSRARPATTGIRARRARRRAGRDGDPRTGGRPVPGRR